MGIVHYAFVRVSQWSVGDGTVLLLHHRYFVAKSRETSGSAHDQYHCDVTLTGTEMSEDNWRGLSTYIHTHIHTHTHTYIHTHTHAHNERRTKGTKKENVRKKKKMRKKQEKRKNETRK
jgi:hypothetical protein